MNKLVLLATAFASTTTTAQAGLMSSLIPSFARSSAANSIHKGGLRRRTRSLFDNTDATAQQRQSLDNMAGEIQSVLAQTLLRQDATKVSLTDDLGGVRFNGRDGDIDDCSLRGKVTFTTHKVKGLTNCHPESSELLPGTEDYQEVVDGQGNPQGYKWHGVWKVVASVPSFSLGLTSQADVDACGTPFDFTSFGGVAVSHAAIELKVRVEAKVSNDRNHLGIESFQVLEQDVAFHTVVSSLGGLARDLPLDYEGDVRSLVEFFFARKLEQPVLGGSQESSSATSF